MLLLLLLSHFSRVRLCATPEMTAHQVPPSLGFSRQEHWSGLPFPSPVHKSKKWNWSPSVVSDSEWPHGLQPTRLLRPWDFPSKSTGVGCHCLLQQGSILQSNAASQTLESTNITCRAVKTGSHLRNSDSGGLGRDEGLSVCISHKLLGDAILWSLVWVTRTTISVIMITSRFRKTVL